MPAPTIVVTPRNHDIGPSQLYLGVTNPLGAVALTLTADGRPPDGAHIGGLLAATTAVIKPKYVDLMVEQYTAPIDSVADTEELDITVTAGEGTILNLKQFLMNSTAVPTLVPNIVTFGGKITVAPISVLIVQPKRDTANTYSYWMGYKMFSVDGVSIDFSRAKYKEWKVKFKCLTDTGRTKGDYLGQYAPEIQGI